VAIHSVAQTSSPSPYAAVDVHHFRGQRMTRVDVKVSAQPGRYENSPSLMGKDPNDNEIEIAFLGQRALDFEKGLGAHVDALETAYGYARQNGSAKGLKRTVETVVEGTLRPMRQPDGKLIWRLLAARWSYTCGDETRVEGKLPQSGA
jgi:hypothetical protein